MRPPHGVACYRQTHARKDSAMTGPRGIYSQSLALLTDLYELTMAYGYWKLNKHGDRAAFHWWVSKTVNVLC